MRTLWLHTVRLYLKIGFFFYFKSVKIQGLQNVPKQKPCLILCNHQNALIDALLIAIYWPQFCYFLTRASVFQSSVFSKILLSLNMLPVYRIRDGYAKLKKNNPVFEACTQMLVDFKNIAVFPEGNHNLQRRVRPLSKGFTRIVFDTLEKHPELDIKIVPVGLNFKKATAFGDSVVVLIGDPINAYAYKNLPRNEAVVKLKSDVHKAISQLTTHIPKDTYQQDLKELQNLNADFLNPIAINDRLSAGLKNSEKRMIPNKNRLKAVFKFLLIMNLIVPYMAWKIWIQPKIVEPEFTATFRFVVAITLVPLYLILMGILINSFFGFEIALGYILSILILDLLAVKL